jgi:hypothetical protein
VRLKTDEFSYKELVGDWYRSKWNEWLSTSPYVVHIHALSLRTLGIYKIGAPRAHLVLFVCPSRINEKAELAAKILLVGDASVGKTAFLTQFMGRAPKGKLDDTTSVHDPFALCVVTPFPSLPSSTPHFLHAQMDRTIFMHGKQIALHIFEMVRYHKPFDLRSPRHV